MALASVGRMSFKMPGRGRVKFGVYAGTLTGYVNGTGVAMNAAAFGLNSLIFVSITIQDGAGEYIVEWNRSTGYAKIYNRSDGNEVANDGGDSLTATILYVGF